jgi:hypothetical protein
MRTAVGLLENETTPGGSLETKRLTAGGNDAYLEKVLTGKEDKTR